MEHLELPREERLRWLLEKSARLHAGGAEPVSGLILPTGTHFPDDFDGSLRAVRRLFRRVVRYAGMSDVSVELHVPIEGEGALTGGGGCSTGGCAKPAPQPEGQRVQRVTAIDDGYRVAILPQEVRNPTVLTVAMIRAVSHVFLKEADLYRTLGAQRDAEAVIDLAGVLLGFGVLLCNGAYIYSKGCGGVHVGSVTALPVEEVALALAIHCRLHGASPRAARVQLDPTPRACFDEAAAWVASNARVVDLVKSDPEAVAAGSYTLSEGRGWLSRLFGVGKRKGPQALGDDDLEQMARDMQDRKDAQPRDDERARRLADLRALVDDAFER